MAEKSHIRRADTRNRRGFFVPALLAAAVGAFLLRLIVSIQLAAGNNMINSVFRPPKSTDLATYMRLAEEIARGVFPETFYYQPYYYSVFLPLILLTGAGVKGVVFCQVICGTIAAFFSGLCARLFAGNRGGIFAAILTATSVPLIFYTPYHQNETLQSLHLILLFYCGLYALLKGTIRSFLLAGAVCGIAIATRGNITLIAILLGVLGCIFPRRVKVKKRLLNAGVMVFAVLVVISPFALRNTLALGKLTGPSTAGDAVLALGNTPEAPAGGRNPGLPAGPMEYPEAFHRVMADTSHGIGLGRSMFNWLCREPLAFFELQFRKALLFWDAREIPNNVSLASDGTLSSLLMLLKKCGFEYYLIICGLAGLFLLGAAFKIRDVRFWWLGGFIAVYWFSIALFYNLSRFRAPILPVLAVAGALLLRRRMRGRKLHRIAALLFSVLVCCFIYDSYRHAEPSIMRVVRPSGTIVPPSIGCKEYDVLDHGPVTFGAWSEVELKNNDVLEKRFAFSGKAKVIWKIYSLYPGSMTVQCGAGKIYDIPLKNGENSFEFDVNDAAECKITVIYVPAKVFAVCDYQRSYSRSSYNGKLLSAEWVARCRMPLDKNANVGYTK